MYCHIHETYNTSHVQYTPVQGWEGHDVLVTSRHMLNTEHVAQAHYTVQMSYQRRNKYVHTLKLLGEFGLASLPQGGLSSYSTVRKHYSKCRGRRGRSARVCTWLFGAPKGARLWS